LNPQQALRHIRWINAFFPAQNAGRLSTSFKKGDLTALDKKIPLALFAHSLLSLVIPLSPNTVA
jgi:hypothetical protein